MFFELLAIIIFKKNEKMKLNIYAIFNAIVPIILLVPIFQNGLAFAQADITENKQTNNLPNGEFRFLGNSIVCKVKTLVEFPCMQIGPYKVGEKYEITAKPMQEIELPKGVTASVFPIVKNETQSAYWVICYKNGAITSVQLTGNFSDPKLSFSSISLADDQGKVKSLLGPRFSTSVVNDINGVEWNYSPFQFTFEFVGGKVYSIRVYDINFEPS